MRVGGREEGKEGGRERWWKPRVNYAGKHDIAKLWGHVCVISTPRVCHVYTTCVSHMCHMSTCTYCTYCIEHIEPLHTGCPQCWNSSRTMQLPTSICRAMSNLWVYAVFIKDRHTDHNGGHYTEATLWDTLPLMLTLHWNPPSFSILGHSGPALLPLHHLC